MTAWTFTKLDTRRMEAQLLIEASSGLQRLLEASMRAEDTKGFS